MDNATQTPTPAPIQIVMLPVKDLTIAPLIKSQPRWSEEDPRYRHFVSDIRARGVQEPLRVDENNVVWDGYDRLRAAKKVRHTEVPVLRCRSEDGPAIAYGSFLHRKHGTKGQRIYAAYPYIIARHEVAQTRHAARLASGGSEISDDPDDSAREICAELGVSHTLFYQAARLHESFLANPSLREEFEPKIMDDDEPISLGAAIAGIAGKKATQGNQRNPSRGGKLGLLIEGLKFSAQRWKHWERLDESEREKAAIAVVKTVAAMPTDLLGEFRRAIARSEKERRAAAADAKG